MELFTPAWKSENLYRALYAVEKMTDQKKLAMVAKEAKNWKVRKAAVEKLTDQNMLADVAKTDSDSGVREAAVAKLANQSVLADMKETTGKIYYERDNRGTRIETMDRSIGYWLGERMQSVQKDPFVYYIFTNRDDARNAMLDLPFIHLAADSGKIICDKLFHFGYFAVTDNGTFTGKYDAFVAGADFTLDLWKITNEIFSKHNGERKNDLKPEKSVDKTAPTVAGNAKNVKFVREDRDATSVWRVHNAPCKADAVAFLSAQTITRSLYYVVVETPEGNFGKDKEGFYQE
jgi:hypothetical protein